MSFGAGHIQDMLNRVKQNTSLKNARHHKFKGGNNYLNTKSTKTEYNFPKISKTELEIIKAKIRNEAAQERKKQFLFWLILIILVIISSLIFNYY